MTDAVLNYINIAVGMIGIVVTVLASPSILGLGASIKFEKLPQELKGFGSGIRLFGILLVLIVFVFILSLGIVLTLIPLASVLGAAQPVLLSVLAVAAIISAAITLALLLLHSPLSLPGIVGTIGLGVLATTAGIVADNRAIAILFSVFFFGFAVTGVIAFLALADRRNNLSD